MKALEYLLHVYINLICTLMHGFDCVSVTLFPMWMDAHTEIGTCSGQYGSICVNATANYTS